MLGAVDVKEVVVVVVAVAAAARTASKDELSPLFRSAKVDGTIGFNIFCEEGLLLFLKLRRVPPIELANVKLVFEDGIFQSSGGRQSVGQSIEGDESKLIINLLFKEIISRVLVSFIYLYFKPSFIFYCYGGIFWCRRHPSTVSEEIV